MRQPSAWGRRIFAAPLASTVPTGCGRAHRRERGERRTSGDAGQHAGDAEGIARRRRTYSPALHSVSARGSVVSLDNGASATITGAATVNAAPAAGRKLFDELNLVTDQGGAVGQGAVSTDTVNEPGPHRLRPPPACSPATRC